jgi:CheY-like chemotaxis protein
MTRARNDERVRTLAEAALRSAERGARLTSQLLAFARRQKLRPETVRIDATLSGIADLLRRAAGETIQVEIGTAKDLWPTRIDAGQFESAVLNLVVNAKDAMPQGGGISIRADNAAVDAETANRLEITSGEYVTLSVHDTGEGMPPDVVENAFEPFFTTKDIGKGTGLGLSQVYGFARQSGGTAVIDSAIGQGTTVTLFLPKTAAAAATTAHQPAAPQYGSARRGPGRQTILVVEDEPDVLDVVSLALVDSGYDTLTARDGTEAMALLAGDQAVDLLLSDIVMPDGPSGVELAQAARQLRPGLRVLLTTGYARDDLASHAGIEAYEVLRKPYRPDDLARQVGDILRDKSPLEAAAVAATPID